jgi:large subunit ribosomal protein L24
MTKMRIKKGDTVVVRSGKFKGRSGKVLNVHPAINKITVEGINTTKRRFKPSRAHPQGGTVDKTLPIFASKLGIASGEGKKPSKLGYKMMAEGKKVRVAKSTGREIK